MKAKILVNEFMHAWQPYAWEYDSMSKSKESMVFGYPHKMSYVSRKIMATLKKKQCSGRTDVVSTFLIRHAIIFVIHEFVDKKYFRWCFLRER